MSREYAVILLLLATSAVASATRGWRHSYGSSHYGTSTKLVKRVKAPYLGSYSVKYFRPFRVVKKVRLVPKPDCPKGKVYDVEAKKCVVEVECPEGTELSLSAEGEEMCVTICEPGTVAAADDDGNIVCAPVCEEGTVLFVDEDGQLVCVSLPPPTPVPEPLPSPTPVPEPLPPPTPIPEPLPPPTPIPEPLPPPTPVPEPLPPPTPVPEPLPPPTPIPEPLPPPTPVPEPLPPPTPVPEPLPPPTPVPEPLPPPTPVPEPLPPPTPVPESPPPPSPLPTPTPPPPEKKCPVRTFFMAKVESKGCTDCDENCEIGACADFIGCGRCKPGFFTQREDPEWPFECFACAAVFPGCKKCSQDIDTLLGESVECLAY